MLRLLRPAIFCLAILAARCGLCAGVEANPPSATMQSPVIRSWGTAEGLPQNTVNAIVQTRDGYLWLATRDGLARFDGVRFKVFGLKEGLPGVEISALLEDHNGVLWIGTAGSGLCRFQAGRFETIVATDHQPGSDTINCLAEDAAGRIWAGTTAGLRFYQDGQLVEDARFRQLSHTPVRCLFRSRTGTNMWIGDVALGLMKFQDGRLEICPGPTDHRRMVPQCFLEDAANRLWVSIGNGVVLCQETNGWKTYTESNGVPFDYVSCLAQDATGTIWAGSLDVGLYRFDNDHFTMLMQKDGLSANDFRSLYCDREGNLWAGTRTGGLDCLSRRKLAVVGAAQGLTNDYTRSVAETPDGLIWVGTTGGSIYRGGLNGFKQFRPLDIIHYYASVDPVLTAPDGSVWWGGSGALMHWQENRLADCFTNEPWLPNGMVTALQNDGHGGLWIGNTRGQLVHLHDGQFTEFPKPLTRAAITALAVQPDGALWVGTAANGLKIISVTGNEVTGITNGLSAKASVRTLKLDNDGTLWIGTAGRGLAVWRHGKIFNFTAAQGVTPSTISQIVEDDHGSLWLGCSRGIFKLPKRDLLDCAEGKQPFVHARSFGLNDGMLSEECSGGFCPAGLKTRSGLICISTVKGLVFLNPGELREDSPPPRALLEEAIVRGQAQPCAETDGKPRLTLAPDTRDVELRYTAINFSAPEKTGFRYRLAPFDDNWIEAGTRRSVNYQHLPPGDFTFHVQACNDNGIWNDADTTLTLTVQPYFWETAWFHALAVLSAAGLLAGALITVTRRRYKRRLERLQMLNAIERERLRISKDMHDHVGSVLTQVSQMTDMGLAESQEPAMQNRLGRIGDRARIAVQALDEIVWATNPKNDNLASFAEYVSRFSDEFFESTPARCWQEIPAVLPPIPLRAEVRHNVFLAVREALNNALKHSHCTEAWLRMKFENGTVTLEVEDNGSGFDSTNPKAGGNGLENFQARLAECDGQATLTSEPGKGTRVRFIFPVKP
jgi:ligand-binding sensor domain-containing protein/signal transduction histidine kinase